MSAKHSPMVIAAARALCHQQAVECNLDEADSWKEYADTLFIPDAKAALDAAAAAAAVRPGRYTIGDDRPKSLHELQDELYEFVTDNAERDGYWLHCQIVTQQHELLEALRQLHRVCAAMDLENESDRPSEDEYLEAMEAAQAVIAKVEGSKP